MIIRHIYILWGFIFLFIFCLSVQVSAGTNPVLVHNSEKSEAHSSIKAAIEAAEPFDTIRVPPAIYTEGNIMITKSLILIGHQYPVLDGEGKYEVFTIIAPHVTIKGFKIVNTGRSSMEDKAAIKCLDAHHVEIEDNILENTFFGIHLSNTHYARISCNRLKSSAQHEYEFGNGIHLWKCNHARIEGNEIQGHRDGIYLEFVIQSEMTENYSICNQRYGLHFMFSHNNRYFHNTFRQNGAGVAVMYTQQVVMKHNVFEDNWGSSSYGMLLKDIRDSEVSHNQFLRNTTGIYMEGSSRTQFHHNIFHRNGHAVKLMASCDDNVFTRNNFSGNTFDVSTNGITVLNELKLNYWDKYEGYDMNRDGIGDIPYRPVSIFAMIVEQVPPAVMLWRSFLVYLLDRAEKVIPAATPENLKDDQPKMRPNVIHL